MEGDLGSIFVLITVLGSVGWWIFIKLFFPTTEAIKRSQVSAASVSGNKQKAVNKLLEIGAIQAARGKVDKALNSYTQALEISREMKNPVSEAICLVKLAQHYHYIGEPKQVNLYLKQARSISKKLAVANEQDEYKFFFKDSSYKESDIQVVEVHLLSEMVDVYNEVGQIPDVIDLYRQILVLGIINGCKVTEVSALSGLGEAYISAGKTQKAISTLRQAFELNKEIGFDIGKVYNLFNLASAYADLGQSKQAIKHIKQAQSFKWGRDSEILADFAFRRGMVYEKIGKYKDAAIDYDILKEEDLFNTECCISHLAI